MSRLRLKSIGENRRQIASADERSFEDCVTGCEFDKEVRLKWNKSIRQNGRQKTIAMISEGLWKTSRNEHEWDSIRANQGTPLQKRSSTPQLSSSTNNVSLSPSRRPSRTY